jgi:hypothetical protein
VKKLRVKFDGAARVKAGLNVVKQEVSGPLMMRGVLVGCRRTVPFVRQNLARQRLTSATSRSIGVKVQKFRDGNGAVGLVGPRRYHRLQHPAFGYRSRGLWRQTNPGTTDPPKIMHLIEGGRKAVRPIRSKVLAFVVPKLRGGQRSSILVPGGLARKLGKKPTPPKKVKGGYLIFAKFAAAAKGTKPMERALPAMERNVTSGVVDTVRKELPAIAAKAAAKGGTIFRG